MLSKEGRQLPASSCSGRRCDSGSPSPPPRSCRTAHTACNKIQSWEPQTPRLEDGEEQAGVRKVVGGPVVLSATRGSRGEELHPHLLLTLAGSLASPSLTSVASCAKQSQRGSPLRPSWVAVDAGLRFTWGGEYLAITCSAPCLWEARQPLLHQLVFRGKMEEGHF